MNNNKVAATVLLAGTLIFSLPVSAQSDGVDVPCIQAAIDARDTALAEMVTSWGTTTGQALEKRRDALKESWEIVSYKARRQVQRRAWSDYGKTLREANTTKTTERRSAWKIFTHARKQCEGAYAPEMKTGSTYDANL
ncbi:MAG: hypothetical protein H0X43_01515 [Nitrosospira sp.]|nr:hypothetical protein [Nitrosospira sp.]